MISNWLAQEQGQGAFLISVKSAASTDRPNN